MKKNKVALEINYGGIRKFGEPFPSLWILREAHKRNIPIKIKKIRGEPIQNLLKKYNEYKIIKQRDDKNSGNYESVYNFDISNLEPQIALPHRVDNGVPISKAKGIAIQQALIGTCTGGRINDIKIAAQILKGKKISYFF